MGTIAQTARPVRARSGNAWYWTRTFLRRHWLPATALAAVIVSLSIGLYVANRERRYAPQSDQSKRDEQ